MPCFCLSSPAPCEVAPSLSDQGRKTGERTYDSLWERESVHRCAKNDGDASTCFRSITERGETSKNTKADREVCVL
jgi:hypothetical protein